MEIRKSVMEDLEEILGVYAYAREVMKRTGNPNQWKDTNPKRETIVLDIENGNHYTVWEDGQICGVFSFIIGEDSTYSYIEGEWLNDEIYGTVHRVASSGKKKGVLDEILHFCESKISNVRIDTHDDNKIMQHLLDKNGYKECGIIYVQDGSPRWAYQKKSNS